MEEVKGRTALITGISGQDGALLANLLLAKGYRVVGTTRRLVHTDFWRLHELGVISNSRLRIVELDLANAATCMDAVRELEPAEVYNLGGMSVIGSSFLDPVGTARATGLGAWNLLEAIRCEHPAARFFQASSSEMFGISEDSPQDEGTCLRPRSPYASAKAFAHSATINYKDSFGVFASSGILYNHESPWRGEEFVTRKITSSVARISRGLQDFLELGNLDAQRDWGYAPEYVEGIWRILQCDSPDSFVLASGRLTTVRAFVEASFKAADMELTWRGAGFEEVGIDSDSGQTRVRVSPKFFRVAEESPLCGNPARSRKTLGWEAAKQVNDICRVMVLADLKRLDTGN